MSPVAVLILFPGSDLDDFVDLEGLRVETSGTSCLMASPEQMQQFLAKRPLTSRLVGLTGHAVERYRERFRPDLDIQEARGALYEKLRESAVFSPTRPPWLVVLNRHTTKVANIGYILIEDEIALPLRENKAPQRSGRHSPQPFAAITCLYRFQL